VTNVDALADSDDDGGDDDGHTHHEYSKPLCIFFVVIGG